MPEHSQEFKVEVSNRTVDYLVISPDEGKLCDEPILLLTFAADRSTNLFQDPYCIPARYFLEHGHRVLSFDLPNHGNRVNEYGSDITGLRNAFVAGCDPFTAFVEDASAAITRCIEMGIAAPGRIAVCGTSRGGYMALRLLAADTRVSAGAGFAPVTDWRMLQEFADDKDRPDIEHLHLAVFADSVASKRVFLAIGNHDDRVSTASCCRFYLDLLEANERLGFSDRQVDFYCTNDVGHSLDDYWYLKGAQFLVASTGCSLG